MKRATAPCGTYRAYKRHRALGEETCEACRAANRAEYSMWATNTRVRAEIKQLEKDMAEQPPIIEWRVGRGRNGGLIQVAVYIDDPYTDHPNRRKTA